MGPQAGSDDSHDNSDDGDDGDDGGSSAVQVVVDVANVVGSRPDGWWRDRAGASARLLTQLSRLAPAGALAGPAGQELHVAGVHAVLEGRARAASRAGSHPGVQVVLAQADGDSAVVALVERLCAGGLPVLAVTADRGLRERLPAGAVVASPGWLRGLLDDLEAAREGE